MKLIRPVAVRVALLVMFVAGIVSRGFAGDNVTQASLAELQIWIDAVNAHIAGEADQWALATARLTYKRREVLNPAMTFFIASLHQQQGHGKVFIKTDDEQKAVDLANRIAQVRGLAVFVKRAVILHSDAAILMERVGGMVDKTVPPPSRTRSDNSGGPSSPLTAPKAPTPLLTNDRFVASRDGEVIGQSLANWNWPFARSLLDVLVPATSTTSFKENCRGPECISSIVPTGPGTVDPFVPAWYHAIAAYMLGKGLYAEVAAHLERAVKALPNEPLILFDRGCYAESFGLPIKQVLRGDFNWWTTRANIPAEADTNAEAESWYGRALAAAPAFIEARVRLGRLIDVRGDHEAALEEINKALAEKPQGVVAFYAHLFAGRAAQSLGRLDDARDQYALAASLFPDAQSAALATSQVALNAADIRGALEPLRILARPVGVVAPDPWWYYYLGAGRDLDDLLATVWGSVPR